MRAAPHDRQNRESGSLRAPQRWHVWCERHPLVGWWPGSILVTPRLQGKPELDMAGTAGVGPDLGPKKGGRDDRPE